MSKNILLIIFIFSISAYAGAAISSNKSDHQSLCSKLNKGPLDGYDLLRMPSNSMANTLLEGDHIIVNLASYKNSSPKRGDVVLFLSPSDPRIKYTKRVIGLPGDKILVTNEDVFINDKKLNEPYINQGSSLFPVIGQLRDMYTVSKDEYFLLGDNRNKSRDSRFYGNIMSKNILGKVEVILYSLTRDNKKRPERTCKPLNQQNYSNLLSYNLKNSLTTKSTVTTLSYGLKNRPPLKVSRY